MSTPLRWLLVGSLAATCALAVGLVPNWERSLHAQSYIDGGIGAGALRDADEERKALANRLNAARTETAIRKWGIFATFERDTIRRRRSRRDDGFDSETPGGLIGIDRRLSDKLLVGAAVGFKVTDVDVDESPNDDIDPSAPGHQRTYTETFGPYMSYSPTPPWYVNASFLVGFLQARTERSGTRTRLNGTARGDTSGHRLSVALASGYDWRYRTLTLGPHASFAYDRVSLEGFDEHGRSDDFDGLLHFADRVDEVVTVKAGPRATYAQRVSWATIIPHVRLDFVYRDTDQPGSKITFLAAPEDSLTLSGARPDPTSIEAGVGLHIVMPNELSCWIDFEKNFLEDDIDRTRLTVGVRKQF